jgi:hypothetical protein
MRKRMTTERKEGRRGRCFQLDDMI